ncbi:MAG: glycine/betaine ABC transporter substrate-binding protein [Catenulispora sp.]|nr:glycine/betaine ABC transporter substrate-binding protein [Catenulispora sp.]
MPVAVSSAAAVVLAAGAVAWYVSDDKSSATGGSALTNNVAPTSQPVTAPPTTSLASNPASNPASGPTPDSTPASSPSTAPATVTVGSFAFPESQVLAEIYAQALTAKGVPVTRKFNIGAREVTDNLLRNGSVSVVPEYNGALLAYLDKAATARSTEDTDAALAAALPAGLEVLAPSPAQDNDALVVTAAVAAANKLKSVADLKRVAGTLVVGAAPEFQTRPQNGLPALNAAYGLKFKDFKALDNGGPLTVAALRDGTVQVADLYTTDSAVVTDHLVVLTDDKHVFGVQNVIPLVNKAGLPTAGADALNAVSAKLTTADLAQLMEQVEVEKKDMADVARTWLANAGLA